MISNLSRDAPALERSTHSILESARNPGARPCSVRDKIRLCFLAVERLVEEFDITLDLFRNLYPQLSRS